MNQEEEFSKRSELHRTAFGTFYPVLWITGLPCSGKTTLAIAMRDILRENLFLVEHLDGDDIRELFPQRGFDRNSRNEHVKNVGFTASILSKNKIVTLVSLISPYEEGRHFARSINPNFLEVYLNTPLEYCEKRDVKGMYKRARNGEILSFTGIHDPYEPPVQAELTIDTSIISLSKSVSLVCQLLAPRLPTEIAAKLLNSLDQQMHTTFSMKDC